MNHQIKCFVLLSILLTVLGCNEDSFEDNEPPTIEKITASPARIKIGELSRLSCKATDSDGDFLNYSWSATGGSFIGGNDKDTVFWKAPTDFGNYYAKVKLSDGKELDDDSIKITAEVKQIHGSFEDPRDGKIYQTIILNNQEWMAENLAFLPSVSPPSSGSDSMPIYYVYGYEGNNIIEAKANSNYLTYGVLYNWTAANESCPSGWHLPTDEDWKQLETNIGMSDEEVNAVDVTYRGTNEGVLLKASNSWIKLGGGTDNYDFKGLPGGMRFFDGNFFHLGKFGSWWSATEDYRLHEPFTRGLRYDYPEIRRGNQRKDEGISIRCVKD